MDGHGQDDQSFSVSPNAAREAANLEGLLTAAPATANGLTLLAVLGMVGNLDHPDYAITNLHIPLLLVGLGLLAGLMSLHRARDQKSREGEARSALERLDGACGHLIVVTRQLEALAVTGPRTAIDKASKRLEEAAADLERVHGKFDRALTDSAKLVIHSRLWNQTSLLLLAAACIVAWSGHAFFGFRLQP